MTARLESSGLRWCFSTLGCAELSLDEICDLAAEFGIPGIELRGISGRMDMPACCKEQGLSPERVGEICSRRRTWPVVAGSSIKLCSASEADRLELVSFCEWANAVRIPYVRVFGGGVWSTPLGDDDLERAVEVVQWWREEKAARQWSVELLLETHDAFSGSKPCLELNARLPQPLSLIWDTHHTWRVGGEPIKSTWQHIGGFVRHVHVKDSVDLASARHPYTYVLPGDGQMPLQDVIELLMQEHFAGHISLEWERFWHPYLPPLRDALARVQSLNWFVARAVTGPILTGVTR